MVECFLRQVLVVQPDVARERGFQIRATLEVVASQHLADATMEAFDHAVGLRATDGRQAVFDAQGCAELVERVLAGGVGTVALESTGVYWIPVYEVLEQRGLKVWLVDARQLKYVPGRKSDVQDCQWLQKLMSLGLLRAAWRPGAEVCVVRAVARQREVLIAEQSSWEQRMQKALVQMNIQLTEVLSDVMGMTGQASIRSIVAGERDPKVLARHRRVKASEEDVVKALTGNWREEHLFVLAQSLAMYDDIARHLAECEDRLQALLAERRRHEVDLGKLPRAGTQQRAGFDARQALAGWSGVDLTSIDGIGVTVATTLLSEIGPDLSRFASVKHFCSWLGLCPGTKISGGKVLSSGTKRSANRARQALKMAAMTCRTAIPPWAPSTAGCACAWTSPGPTRPQRTSSRGWCTSC